MNTNMLALASSLSDQDLLARIDALANKEREASVELVAHLAALDARPALYAAKGYGSLFSYCTDVLRLSEDATCNRIYAARACRLFPLILDLLGSGAMSLTSVRMLRQYLTPENHQGVLARASGRSRREIEALVAELAPRPDVPPSVRKVPAPPPTPSSGSMPLLASTPCSSAPPVEAIAISAEPSPPIVAPPRTCLPTPRPIIQITSPDRYRVQFTIGKESHDKLRRVQTLLRREIPDGDPGAIFDRAVTLLLEKVEKTKLAATTKPRTPRPIRPGADKECGKPVPTSRHIPSHVQRAVWRRDSGQCAFVAPGGQRCARSWSTTTSGPMRRGDRRPSRTSRFVVGATTNTRRSWFSAVTVLRWSVRRKAFSSQREV